MSDTLLQLIPKIQAQLGDNGTLFPTATVTAAVRQALEEISQKAPLHAAVTITAMANQQVYELSDEDPSASGITDVLLDGDNDYSTGLEYDAYVEDERWFFRLRQPQTAGETLIVQYTKPQTVSGLDGATDSTAEGSLNTALVDGACYYCALIRAAATVESNNLQPEVSQNWLRLANQWRDVFDLQLAVARQQNTARGEPSSILWNDPQHDPTYP